MSHQYHRDFDRDRDPRGGVEGGRGEYQDNNYHQQHRHPYHSPAAPEYSNSHASTAGGYGPGSRHAGGERGKSRDERGAYGGAETHVNHRRRGERDWDRSTGGDMYSDRDWEREGQDGRNDWDTDRGSSRDNYGSRGRGVQTSSSLISNPNPSRITSRQGGAPKKGLLSRSRLSRLSRLSRSRSRSRSLRSRSLRSQYLSRSR